MTDQNFKTEENKLRRAARRQGLELKKNRRRDPLALGYGTYCLTDWRGNAIAGEQLSYTEVVRYLKSGIGSKVAA